MNVDLRGDAWVVQVTAQSHEKLLQAGAHLVAKLKEITSLATSPPPSLPGEPPHIDTGELNASIRADLVGDGIRISTAEHGVFLEYGTVKMAPRYFLRATVAAEQDTIQRILAL